METAGLRLEISATGVGRAEVRLRRPLALSHGRRENFS